MDMAAAPYQDIYYTSNDGLNLYARDYGPKDGGGCPVLCLAGLTRNSKDFHKLATRLSTNRRVIVPDYRGRGLSDYAAKWQTYEPDVEMDDVLRLADKCGLDHFAVIGTSRGGLISMLKASTNKHRLTGVVLNDIGPRIENDGLIAIADSINARPEFESWQGVADALKAYAKGLNGLSNDDWMAFAQRLYREKNGLIIPDYDPNLTRTFPTSDFIREGKIPEVWPLFEAFAGLPLAVVRGANSDLLSRETVRKMADIHPGLITAEVPDRAHVPFLDEPEALVAIDAVLAGADREYNHA